MVSQKQNLFLSVSWYIFKPSWYIFKPTYLTLTAYDNHQFHTAKFLQNVEKLKKNAIIEQYEYMSVSRHQKQQKRIVKRWMFSIQHNIASKSHYYTLLHGWKCTYIILKQLFFWCFKEPISLSYMEHTAHAYYYHNSHLCNTVYIQ